MTIRKPTPLYPSYVELGDFSQLDYPGIAEGLASGEDWCLVHWQWGKEFLEYIGRNKSEHTYIRFRNEVERFLLWSFYIKEKPIDEYRKSDILEYADFCWKPPVSWISTSNEDRFIRKEGIFKSNPQWHP